MRQFNKIFISVLTYSILLLIHTNAVANRAQVTGYTNNPTNGNATCSQCHLPTANIIPPTVKIEGPLEVEAGSINTYKFTMVRQDTSTVKLIDRIGGINVSVDSGSLSSNELKMKAVRPVIGVNYIELTHVIDTLATTPVNNQIEPKKVFEADGRTLTWLVEWKAPDVEGAINLYASLMSGDNSSDVINDSSRNITLAVNVVANLNTTPGTPVAKIRAPLSAIVGTPILFVGSESYVEKGTGFIEKYNWVFSDEVVSNEEQVYKSFSTAGTHTAKLTVTTNKPGKLNSTVADTRTTYTFVDITIIPSNDNSKLVPVAKISAPASANANAPVLFDASSSSPQQSIKEYFWDFGDGSALINDATPTIEHTFLNNGDFKVTLAVKTKDTLNNTVTKKGITNIDQFMISIVNGSGTTQQDTGEQLFTIAGCAGGGCHGAGGAANGTVKDIRGATQQLIDDSVAGVNSVPVSMISSIAKAKASNTSNISSSQLMSVYLGKIMAGATLYETRCLICHGVNADGVLAAGNPIRGKGIKGAKASTILNAINQAPTTRNTKIPLMNGIQLSGPEATLLENYLIIPAGTTGSSAVGAMLFATNCELCHGPGTGGWASSVVNMTATQIDAAIKNITVMDQITLNATEMLDIEAYLSGTLTPQPTVGMALYNMYCSNCHGVDGQGGNGRGQISEKSIAGKTFTPEEIMDAYINNIDAMKNSKLGVVGFTLTGPELNLSLIAKHIEQLNGGE